MAAQSTAAGAGGCRRLVTHLQEPSLTSSAYLKCWQADGPCNHKPCKAAHPVPPPQPALAFPRFPPLAYRLAEHGVPLLLGAVLGAAAVLAVQGLQARLHLGHARLGGGLLSSACRCRVAQLEGVRVRPARWNGGGGGVGWRGEGTWELCKRVGVLDPPGKAGRGLRCAEGQETSQPHRVVEEGAETRARRRACGSLHCGRRRAKPAP